MEKLPNQYHILENESKLCKQCILGIASIAIGIGGFVIALLI